MVELKKVITERAESRIPWDWLKKQRIYHGYFAGGGLLRADANDIDLFPVEGHDFMPENNDGLIMSTPNASTYKAGNVTAQLCNFKHPSLKVLVESFDFAHIMAGVEFSIEPYAHTIRDVYISPNFRAAHEAETSYFTGSEYPLSSLMRLVKYAKRDIFPGRGYMPVVIDILDAILSRGFKDYDDFKDQLDAVDLGMLDSDFNRNTLLRIFDRLKRQ